MIPLAPRPTTAAGRALQISAGAAGETIESEGERGGHESTPSVKFTKVCFKSPTPNAGGTSD
ncbi:hypothetical protein N9M16_09850 [Candidatus Dependentiae bacterium]|nr:hypothetical protein [Candidatus Dependentiae bacterium]